MTYLGPKVLANFKPPVNPNKTRELRSKDKRPGMNPEHLANIRKLPCLLTGKKPCDPHHLKVKNERGVGLKSTDQWAVPLCRSKHNEVEKLGSRRESFWFANQGIPNIYAVAKALWNARGDLEAMERIVMANLPSGD